ncbi:hypothetical protein [Aureimonas pseudogalii]|uniref:Uncharacterized protein n=1 Tax=Aureimonas pseudogalii TaxID=1744844 RepID=A0A7W6E8Y6_9HYPH|nr:hypothetical protein [Aureimonas pseudogalii]MBB3996908.1 hypothetical protein [Aureimonas pseudogalii]
MKKIRDATVVLGMLEDGQFASDLSESIRATLDALNERAGTKGKAKGSIAVKLDLVVSNGMVTIDCTLDAKTPKPERGSTVLFVTDDGSLSTEHPKQMTMFPRDADERRRVGDDD